MSSKINIYGIVRDHVLTLRDDRTGRVDKIDIFTFFVLPGVLGVAAWYIDIKYSENFLLGGIAALSVFAGLLINVLVLIYTIGQAPTFSSGTVSPTKTKEFICHTVSNISFSICNALVNILALYYLLFEYPERLPAVVGVMSFFFINFVLSILMVLKRIHAMIKISI